MLTLRLRAPIALMLLGGVAACSDTAPGVGRAPVDPLAALDAREVGEVMLAVAKPEEAVMHFQRVAAAKPGDTAARRGLATSLMRAGRYEDAVPAWRALADASAATPQDRVSLAEALVRTGDWDAARAALGDVPKGHDTARRHRIEAMVADADGAWGRADGHYEIAARLSPQPGGVLNNWGFSKLTRGDEAGAERLFERALDADPALFTAKNNLAMARGARGEYEVPLVPMTQTERATVLHTLALAAVKAGDVAIGRSLLSDAVATHPRHFEPAARALAALDAAPGDAPATLADAERGPTRIKLAPRVPTNALDAVRPADKMLEAPVARIVDASATVDGEPFP